MQYIAAISGEQQDVMRVKDVILESNPLLEAFGMSSPSFFASQLGLFTCVFSLKVMPKQFETTIAVVLYVSVFSMLIKRRFVH